MKNLFSIVTIDILYKLAYNHTSRPLIRQLARLSLLRLNFDPNEASCDELKENISESCMNDVKLLFKRLWREWDGMLCRNIWGFFFVWPGCKHSWWYTRKATISSSIACKVSSAKQRSSKNRRSTTSRKFHENSKNKWNSSHDRIKD